MAQLNSVSILPGVNVLSVLPHLNYKPWFALAEFVDNSIQSSISHKNELNRQQGSSYRLKVEITFDQTDNLICIKDNAAGIFEKDYGRAFRPAAIPPDASGLSEFGMGMKSAACWFSPEWSVRTSALGENIERTVIFNVNQIVSDSIEELNVISIPTSTSHHYTEIRLENIRRFPKGKTVVKIKEHLASIYRVYLREGLLDLYVDGQKLEYTEPAVLDAPYYKKPSEPPLVWKKEIDFELDENKYAKGFVAIRETASTKFAGLALFRRKRLILGSVDETYRPEDIFGRSTSFVYQRVYGEIHLHGFSVSHTKDGIQWEDYEDIFLSELRHVLEQEDMPILDQARNYRAKSQVVGSRNTAVSALNNTSKSFQDLSLPEPQSGDHSRESPRDYDYEVTDKNEEKLESAGFEVSFRGETWLVEVELSYEDDGSDWLTVVSKPTIKDPEPRKVTIRINMYHRFMVQYPSLDQQSFEAVLKIAAALSLSEVIASEVGDSNTSSIRRCLNEILRNDIVSGVVDAG